MDLLQLKEDASYFIRKAEEIAKATGETGVLTEDQKSEIAALRKQAAEKMDEIEDRRATEALQGEVAADAERLRKPKEERKVKQGPIGESYEAKTMEMVGASPTRYASFKGKDAERSATKAGLWLKANMFQHPNQVRHPSVVEAQRQVNESFPELRALGTTTNASGGAVVPQELAAAIIERREQFGVFEGLTNRVPVNDSALWPRVTSDQLAAFGNEGSAATEADITLDNIELNPKPMKTISRINNELINSASVDIAEFVARDFGRRFAQRIDTCGFTAAGEVVNGGITGAFAQLESNTSYAGNIVAAGATTASVTSANLSDMLGILPEYAAQAEPFWICNRAVKEGVFGRLQMASGGVTKLETTHGTFDSYSGVPIVTTQLAKSPGTTDDVFLLLGDLRLASFMGVSDELTFTTSSERYFELNQTAIRGVMRLDINVYDYGSTTAADEGSIVALRST